MSKVLNNIERVIHLISNWYSEFAILPLSAMMFMIAADVILRYVLKRPIVGSTDLVHLMLVFVVFCPMAYTQFRKGHVTVTLITSRMGQRTTEILKVVVNFLGMVTAAGIGVGTLNYGRIVLLGQTSDSPATLTLLIPTAPFMIIAGAGLILLSVELLTDFVHSAINVSREFRRQADES